LKHPLGRLIIGSPERTVQVLKEIIEHENPPKLIAIGDVVASNMMRNHIKVNCIVVDFKSKRQPLERTSLENFEVVNVKNPSGVITSAAYEAVKEACTKHIQGGSALAIVVEGEEDLLTLPVVKYAPLGALVVYGQPHVGIVVVKVTERIRNYVELLMSKMA
jgi:uncharacterized protein (UPF0218 family)